MPHLKPILDAVAARLEWVPDWAISVALILLAVLVVRFVHAWAFGVLQRHIAEGRLFWRSLVARTAGPSRLALMIGAASAVGNARNLPPEIATRLNQVLLIAFVALVGWALVSALHVASVVHLRHFKLDSEDNLLARKHVTQMRILERAGVTLIVIVTAAVALMTIDSVRQYGVSLLASAGAAGLILGLAMQPVLSNLVAGIQIAITQPIRIEDAIIVEKEWGWVEEITSTYVVVRLWDWRRLVLPLTYFIQKPFQNWTREEASLIGSVFLYLDHTAPFDAMRDELQRIVQRSRLWDGRVVNLQVSDVREAVVEVRLLVSARNAPQAWDFRCEVREAMLTFLRDHHPGALPRRRAELVGRAEREDVLGIRLEAAA